MRPVTPLVRRRRLILGSILGVFGLGLGGVGLGDSEVAYRWWRRAPDLTLERTPSTATPLLPDPTALSLPVDEALRLTMLELEAPRDRLSHLTRMPGSEWVVAGGQGGLVFLDLSARQVVDGCFELPRSAIHLLDTRDGLPDLRIEALLAEPGRVWVGTRGGLAEVRLGPEGPVVEAGRFEGLASPRISALARAGGRLLVATHDGGLHRLEGDRLLPLRQLGRRGRQLEALLALPADAGRPSVVLFAGRRGLGQLEDNTVTWLGEAWVSQLRRTSGGRVLAGGPEGLFAVQGGGLVRLSARPVARLLGTRCRGEVCDGVLPVGLDGRVLGAAETSARLADRARLEVAGLVLAATGRGLALRDAAGHRHLIRLGGIGDADVSALLARGSRLHVGTYDDGLWIVEDGVPRRIVPAIARVDALTEDGAGGLLVATPDGLWALPASGDAQRYGLAEGLPSAHVTDVCLTPAGELWVATAAGVALGRFADAWSFRFWDEGSGLPLSNFGVAAALPDGRIAFGALHGLVLREADGVFHALRPGDGGLPDGWVTAIAADADGRVFLGTYDAGLLRLVGDRVERLAIGIGASHGRVNPRALTFLGEHLLAGTSGGGLLVVGPAGTRTFGPRDGLPSAEVTALATTGDSVYVGTRSGLARVRLDASPSPTRPQEVASR